MSLQYNAVPLTMSIPTDPFPLFMPESTFSPTKSFCFDINLHKLPSSAIPTLLHIFQDIFTDTEAVIYAKHILTPLQLPEESFFTALSPTEWSLAWRSCLLVYIASQGAIIPQDDQIQAALWPSQSVDSVVIAPTGWGKTMCILIPLLLFLTTTSITVSPLKHLQLMQAQSFKHLHIQMLPINEDTDHADKVWKDVFNGSIAHLIVQPEQLQLCNGHKTRLSKYLDMLKFASCVKHVHIDEAHFVAMAGLPINGNAPFWAAWGLLDEFHHHLPSNLLLSPHTIIICQSINRPNIIYAKLPLVKSITELCNFDCIVPQPFHPPMCLPKVILFHDNKVQATTLSQYLNAHLPETFQKLGISKHYHSDMSLEYLEKTYNDFAEDDSHCLILNVTSAASHGVDARGINMVIQVGMCTELPEFLQ
ncbi:hypothetical protein F5146DRAFT_1132651 [Armillaria mellea]|nr:hypothetical protein F5146DRAFT_1132651 [Armillaria mellea]